MIFNEYICQANSKRIMIITDTHYCDKVWHNTENAKRMKYLCEDIVEEYKNNGYDCILGLGDYSLDFWEWCEGGSYLWDSPVNNTENFVKMYV